MARNKNSTALFEVIANGRPLNQQSRPGLFRTAASWFGSRSAPVATDPIYRTVPANDPEMATLDVHRPAKPVLALDPDRREVLLRLSYFSAITSAFALVTIVAAAFLTGRRVALAHRPIISPDSTEQLRAGPAQANLVDIRRVNDEGTNAGQHNQGPIGQTNPPAGRSHVVGLNYVVIQSYPDVNMATQAMNALIQNGVDCMVQKGLKDWGRSGWYTVIGYEGFTQVTNSPKLEAYTANIMKISDKFTKRGTFKAFAPALYKWKLQN